jgi:hypothetical protein
LLAKRLHVIKVMIRRQRAERLFQRPDLHRKKARVVLPILVVWNHNLPECTQQSYIAPHQMIQSGEVVCLCSNAPYPKGWLVLALLTVSSYVRF